MAKTKKNTRVGRMEKLLSIALEQHGYFTAHQAEEAGYLATNFPYHVKSGAWIREGRGIYRLKTHLPHSSRYEQMMFYQLWSRGRDEKPQGIYSHETALSLFELTDVMPVKLHMSVPKTFRKWAKTPKVLKLFYNDLQPEDITIVEGLRVTRPLRTVLDLIRDGTTSPEFIEQAIQEGLERGLIRLSELETHAASSPQVKEMLEQALKKMKPQRKAAAG